MNTADTTASSAEQPIEMTPIAGPNSDDDETKELRHPSDPDAPEAPGLPGPVVPKKRPKGWRRPVNGELLVIAASPVLAVLAMVAAWLLYRPDMTVEKYFAITLVGGTAVAAFAAVLRIVAHFNDDKRWDLAAKSIAASATLYVLLFSLTQIEIII